MSSLGVPMNDSAVVGLFSASIKCTPPLLNTSLFSLVLSSTYDRDDGELTFQAFPGIFREEAIMLLRDFYMQENHHGTRPRLTDHSTQPQTQKYPEKETRFRSIDMDEIYL